MAEIQVPFVAREMYGVVSASDGQRIADLEATVVRLHQARQVDARVMERLERRANELEGALGELVRHTTELARIVADLRDRVEGPAA